MKTRHFTIFKDGEVHELYLLPDQLSHLINSLNVDLRNARENRDYTKMKTHHERDSLGDRSSSMFNERSFSFPNYASFIGWRRIGTLKNYKYYENISVLRLSSDNMVLGNYGSVRLKASYDSDRNIENLFFDGGWSPELPSKSLKYKLEKLLLLETTVGVPESRLNFLERGARKVLEFGERYGKKQILEETLK